MFYNKPAAAHKLIGEMEETVLESFCAAVNLKVLLLRGQDIPAVHQCASLVDKTSELFPPDKRFPEAIDQLREDTRIGDRRPVSVQR